MSYRPLTAVVLAAGEGTRMRSSRPKPLHVLCGRPMLLHVLDALSELPVERAVVVVGHGAERVAKTLQEKAPGHLILDFVEQHVPRGTGDAASAALTAFPDDLETAGVNDRVQLAAVEGALRQRINERWMRRGVTMLDPERTYVDASVRLSPDVTLFPGTMLQGDTAVGPGARIGPDVRLTDCAVAEGAIVEQTVGEHAEVGADAVVGPFAALPPGSHVAPGHRTGAFYTGTGGEDDSG